MHPSFEAVVLALCAAAWSGVARAAAEPPQQAPTELHPRSERGWAANRIEGQVVDRDGEPLPRTFVTISPGDVEVVTDRHGRFTFEYLRDDAGRQVRIRNRTEYTLEVEKDGYHPGEYRLRYRGGRVTLDPIPLLVDGFGPGPPISCR